MTIKRQDPEFLHPDTVAQLRGLTDEEAAKHSPIIRERDGVFMQQRRIGRRVLCREVEASGVPALETGALHAAAEAEFGRSLPILTAEFLGGGAKRYAALLETVDAHLADSKSRPSCPSCGQRMERRGRVGKTFGTRLGEVRVKRRYFYCRKCGVGDYPLDRALRLAGKRVTPGAEAVYADAAGSDSYEEARRKLWNLAGVTVSRATDGAGWSSASACGSSGSGTACSRPGNWRCCPTGRPGSATAARRRSPDRRRPSSSTCSTPSNMRTPP